MIAAVSSDKSSYPGGKSGAGIYQRLINLIPPHRVLVVPFAGHCGVVRNIRPAEQTIVIDQDPAVCQWWDDWSRSKQGRRLEIHHCDGIEWLRFRLGGTEYSAAKACDAGSGAGRSSGSGSQQRRPAMATECDRISPKSATAAGDAFSSDAAGGVDRPSRESASEYFVFCDPPYVMSQRATGRIYQHELSDADHERLVGTVTRIDAAKALIMVCGYPSDLYDGLAGWLRIHHRVPTRRGLQDERMWLNYQKPARLHDYQFIGDCRRSRERIRRRQRNWHTQLMAMSPAERAAMLESLRDVE
jgi:hypothetical protein